MTGLDHQAVPDPVPHQAIPLPWAGDLFLLPPSPTQDYGVDTLRIRAVRLARPRRRLAARVLDTVIVLLGVLLFIILGEVTHVPVRGFVHVALVVWVLLYEPLLTTCYGGALGKLALGLRVVRNDDARRQPNFGMSFWRWVFTLGFRVIPFGFLVDSFWLLGDRPLYRCLHDMAARTLVIRVQR